MNALERVLDAADRWQQRRTALAFPVAVWRKFADDRAANLAALISYYGFAALLPLLLVLVTVLDIVLKNDPALRASLVDSALARYPIIGARIEGRLGSISGTGAPIAVGAVLALLGARGVAGAMQNALCEVWGIPRADRPGFPWSLLQGMALVFTVGTGFIVTTFLSGLAGGAGHVLTGAGAHAGAVAVSLLTNVGLFWLAFKIATAGRVRWRDLRTGAVVAAACWQVLQVAGGYVVSHQLQRSSDLYGVFGVVLGLLAWLYLQAEVTLYAAEIDVVLTRRLWPRSLRSGRRAPGRRRGRRRATIRLATTRREDRMNDAPHVVIAGAGFAGLAAVGSLRKAAVRVTVIDRNLYSTFQPLLYQVATGGLNPGDIAYPVGGFTARRGARYIRGELASVDAGARLVRLAGGREIRYDCLILATGVAASYFGVPGAAENTFGLYTRADAIVLRDHIMAGFERLSADASGRREFAVTVVGGGATGVELAGTLGELRSDVLRATFPDVDPARLHVRLVEMAPDLLMPFHPRLRAYTRRQLAGRGVDIRLSTKILQVQPDRVVLGDGTSLSSDLTVWAAGVAAPAAMAGWGLPQGAGGRVLVGADLRVEGCDRVFAAGDVALYAGRPSPQLAQPALQQGRHAAEQVIRLLRGEPPEPFGYRDKGIMATIGRRSAVVQMPRGARFTGTLAWLAWLGLHLLYLLGYRNRVATLINLSWRYIAWGHGGGVIVGDEPAEPLPGEA